MIPTHETLVSFLEKSSYDHGYALKHTVEGTNLAFNFIAKVLTHQKFKHRLYDLDGDFIKELHNQLYFLGRRSPRMSSLRITRVNTRGREAVKPDQLIYRFPLYCLMFQDQIQSIQNHPNDIINALYGASAISYGLLTQDLHPFMDGNKRMAMALTNVALMVGTEELRIHRKPIIPLSMVSNTDERQHLLDSLDNVDDTWNLNSMMDLTARRWVSGIDSLLDTVQPLRRRRNQADKSLLESFEKRRTSLLEYLADVNVDRQCTVAPYTMKKSAGKGRMYRAYEFPERLVKLKTLI